MTTVSGERKKGRRARREGGPVGDDDGPFLGWPELELGCGQFLFFFDKTFSFSFFLVLKLTIKS